MGESEDKQPSTRTQAMPPRGELSSGQDWSTVAFSNRPSGGGGGQSSARGGGGGGPKQSTPGGQVTASGISAAKLEDDTENLSHAKVGNDLKDAIQKGRNAKGMTQKALAGVMQVQPKIIQEYEQGKAIPNGAMIAKFEKALGVKLPRPPKGGKK